MIHLSLGKLGSGKTLTQVRRIAMDKSNMKYYSNIKIDSPNAILLKTSMIIQTEVVGEKKKKNGEINPIVNKTFNKQFWVNVPKPISVVIDEIGQISNSRRSMSKTNIIINTWLVSLRRALGGLEYGQGDLVLIAQDIMQVDKLIRDLSVNIIYNISHWVKKCQKCGYGVYETSEMPEFMSVCRRCKSIELKKERLSIQLFYFNSVSSYNAWKIAGYRTYYKNEIIHDAHKYWNLYDTLQWDNLFEDEY